MKNYKIYTLNDPMTNEIKYVGQTCRTLQTRLTEHIRDAKNNIYKYRWIEKLKRNNLKPTINLIIDKLSKEECNNLEIRLIKEYKEAGHKLVNLTEGGEGTTGYKHINIKYGENNHFYGKHHTEETKKLLSEIRRKNTTPENRKLISELATERWKNASVETRNKNIINQKGRRTIHQLTLDGKYINEHISLRQIERDLGYFRANITPCLKGEFKQAYGYIWRYAN